MIKLHLAWLSGTILFHEDAQDMIFEDKQQEDFDKNKQMDQTA